MPGKKFASKAQQRMMHHLEETGEIAHEAVTDRDKNTDFANLPEKKLKAARLRKHLRGKK